jgi:predicted RNA binding protein YcfA (HicA-like mRNA interferase family)
MSEHLPALFGTEMVKILQRNGFIEIRQSGSHTTMRHADGRQTTVPIYGRTALGKGLLRQIMRDAALTSEQLRS